jgi:hypothetical protein
VQGVCYLDSRKASRAIHPSLYSKVEPYFPVNPDVNVMKWKNLAEGTTTFFNEDCRGEDRDLKSRMFVSRRTNVS